MKISSRSLAGKIKVSALSMATAGMLYGAACTAGDLRHNVVNGTLSFVKGYTGDLWEALVPPAGELVNADDAAE